MKEENISAFVPNIMSGQRDDGAYVRAPRDSEIPQIVSVLTRAFADDPAMNWLGGVTHSERIPSHTSTFPSAVRTMKRLHHFQEFVTKGTFLVGGLITVVAKPDSEKENSEKIVAVSLWMPPGSTWDLGVLQLIRVGVLKCLFSGWGWSGMSRVTKIFTPHVDAVLDKAFKSRGLDRLDSWHLLEVVTDPDEERKGYCSMLMQEGFARTHPKPVHLEATTVASRDIYLHYGFEIDEETRFGKGEVNDHGVRAAKDEAADGYPEWIMTKWKY